MNTEMMEALQAMAAERGITVDALYSALADALESAYKRLPDAKEYAWVTIDPTSLEFRVLAQDLDADGNPVGEEYEVTPGNFGRIAAQTARQVMTPAHPARRSGSSSTRSTRAARGTSSPA